MKYVLALILMGACSGGGQSPSVSPAPEPPTVVIPDTPPTTTLPPKRDKDAHLEGVFTTVTLAWDRNPESDVIGYRVYRGPQSGQLTQSIDVGNVTEVVIGNLSHNTRYVFGVTALNAAGLESLMSDELVVELGPPDPNPPIEPRIWAFSISNGTAKMSLTGGQVGVEYIVQVSTDLVNWTDAQSVVFTSLGQVAMLSIPVGERAFFRVGWRE